MDDAEQLDFYANDSTDDSEYDESGEPPRLALRFLASIGAAVLAAAAGYLLGWTVSLILDRYTS